MTNPLLDTFDEMYGEKKEEIVEEVVEDKEDELREELKSKLSALHSGAFTTAITNAPVHGQLSFNASTNELSVYNGLTDQVIPTATVSNGRMSMNGDYIKADALISNGTTVSHINPAPTCFAFDAPKTEMEKHFLKVLEDLANKKSVVSSIRADIDASFTGFGGQIKYSIEIVGRYP
jgi:tRNA U34 5-methylaminomethyl-2-thiouridine-forming methyltransferase MnmC